MIYVGVDPGKKGGYAVIADDALCGIEVHVWDDDGFVTLMKEMSKYRCMACVERCPRGVKPGKLIDAARQVVIRQRGQEYLSPDEIPELLDEETPQQLLMSAFRKYRR